MIPYRLLLILSIFLLNLPCDAQTYLGWKGGINRSHSALLFDLQPRTITSTGDLFGFYFGLPFEYQLNDLVNFIPEVALVSEGSVVSVSIQEEERTYNNLILYAKVPLVAKLKLLKNNDYEFGIVGGVVPAYALAIKSFYFSSNSFSRSVEEDTDFEKAGVRRYDLGLVMGLNTEKVIAKGLKLTIDLRYHLGLLDIQAISQLTNTTESLNLTIGLLTPIFKGKKKK